jgi:CubicO group peptidase (beta-lactamase class C family)
MVIIIVIYLKLLGGYIYMDIRLHTEQADISLEEAQYDPQALEHLDQMLKSLIIEKKLQGASYLLARNGRTFSIKSMGAIHHSKESGDLLPNSIRRIASITKWFTLVAILQLMEEGKLYLDQPVKDWLKEFDHPYYEKISIFHLLTHTSGIAVDGGYFTEPYPAGWYDYEFAFAEEDEAIRNSWTPEEARAHSKSQWIKAVLAGTPVSEPGETWSYSTAGFVLLGEIVSMISGVSFEDYVIKKIIQPLKLERTFFDVPASLHDEICVVSNREWEWMNKKFDRAYLPPRAGSGIYSTLTDLYRFGQMLLNEGTLDGERILSRKSVELLRQNHLQKGTSAYHWGDQIENFRFGLSSSLGRMEDSFTPTTFYHEGAGRSAVMVDHAEQFVVVFFVPTDVDWVAESIFNVRNIIWSGLR